jgi:ATP-dependent RNA helicase RhlE
VALSFCDEEEREYLKEINGLIKTSIPVIEDHPFKSNYSENNSPDVPVKKYRSSNKPGSSRFSKDPRKRWVRISRSTNAKR